jgi:hypothetical protein
MQYPDTQRWLPMQTRSIDDVLLSVEIRRQQEVWCYGLLRRIVCQIDITLGLPTVCCVHGQAGQRHPHDRPFGIRVRRDRVVHQRLSG